MLGDNHTVTVNQLREKLNSVIDYISTKDDQLKYIENHKNNGRVLSKHILKEMVKLENFVKMMHHSNAIYEINNLPIPSTDIDHEEIMDSEYNREIPVDKLIFGYKKLEEKYEDLKQTVNLLETKASLFQKKHNKEHKEKKHQESKHQESEGQPEFQTIEQPQEKEHLVIEEECHALVIEKPIVLNSHLLSKTTSSCNQVNNTSRFDDEYEDYGRFESDSDTSLLSKTISSSNQVNNTSRFDDEYEDYGRFESDSEYGSVDDEEERDCNLAPFTWLVQRSNNEVIEEDTFPFNPSL